MSLLEAQVCRYWKLKYVVVAFKYVVIAASTHVIVALVNLNDVLVALIQVKYD